jgi:hypothetical protein
MRVGVVAGLIQLCLLGAVVSGASADTRLPIPDATAQAKARKLVNEVYGDRIAAATSPEQKTELARTLLQRGTETRDSDAARYVAWTTAQAEAIDAGNADLTLAVLKQLVTTFSVDTDATTLEALTRLGETAHSPADRKRAFDEADQLGNSAVSDTRFDIATSAADLTLKLANLAHDQAQMARASAQSKVVHDIAAANATLDGPREALAKDPKDPHANLAVGSFLCFMQADWSRGLPLLALGDNPAIATTAKADLANPLLGSAQAAVADKWWELSQKMTGVTRMRVQARAAMWYKQAEPNLDGIARDQAQRRLSEIASATSASSIATTGPSTIVKSDTMPPASVPVDDPILQRIKVLQDRGWHAQAAAVARTALADEKTSSRVRSVLRVRGGKLLVYHAQACLDFGVAELSRRWLQDATTATDVQIDTPEMGELKSSLRALPADPPGELLAAAPLGGDVSWTSQPRGYAIPSPIQVGNSDHNHGGSWLAGKVQVQPGVYIHGGTIRVSGGSIDFKGSPTKPVFLDGVRIECEYTGSVSAQNTVFQNCVFAKTGGFFRNGGYSSKWTFLDCLFQNSNFASLSRMDYGIRIGRCTFSECKLPARNWGYRKTESASDDGAKRTRNTWSQLIDCDFYDCPISISALWVTEGCNFYGCSIDGTANFLSRTDLQSEVGVLPSDKTFVQELTAKTTAGGEGHLIYTAAKPFPRLRASPFWKLLDKSSNN